MTGGVPANVTFHVGATDADGDRLNGTLAFGDGSPNATVTTFPGTVMHRYTAAGNRTATLRVTDGQATGTANVTLRLAVAPTAGKPPLLFTTHIDAPDPIAAAEGECAGAIFLSGTPAGGHLGATFKLPHGVDGAPFALAPAAGMQVRWDDGAAHYLGDKSTSGKVPAGSTQAYVCGVGSGAVNVDVTLTISPA